MTLIGKRVAEFSPAIIGALKRQPEAFNAFARAIEIGRQAPMKFDPSAPEMPYLIQVELQRACQLLETDEELLKLFRPDIIWPLLNEMTVEVLIPGAGHSVPILLWPGMHSVIEQIEPGRIGGGRTSIEYEEQPRLNPWFDELRAAAAGRSKPGLKHLYTDPKRFRADLRAKRTGPVGRRMSVRAMATGLGMDRETLKSTAVRLGVDLEAELRGVGLDTSV